MKIGLLTVFLLLLNSNSFGQKVVSDKRPMALEYGLTTALLTAENTYYDNGLFGFDKESGYYLGFNIGWLISLNKYLSFELGGGMGLYNVSGYYHCHVCGIATPIELRSISSFNIEIAPKLRFEIAQPIWTFYSGLGLVGNEMIHFDNELDLVFPNEEGSYVNAAASFELGLSRKLNENLAFNANIYYNKTLFRTYYIPLDMVGIEVGLKLNSTK